MRFTIAVGCALLLGGCVAVTTDTIQGAESRVEFDTRRLVDDAANCLVKNAQRADSTYSGQVRPGPSPASREVVIRVPDGIVSYATIAPSGAGSFITLWVRTMYGDDRLLGQLKEGC